MRVVRGAARADVDRRGQQVRAQHLASVKRVVEPGDRVVLRTVPGGVGDVGDRAGVVQESVVVAHDGVKAELVGDVGLRVSAVGYVDLIQRRVVELVEVRAAVRLLERVEVGDQSGEAGTVGLTNA